MRILQYYELNFVFLYTYGKWMVKHMPLVASTQASWINQDVLKLSSDEWKQVLWDPQIFSSEALRMVLFVYNQSEHQSTPSAIAQAFSTYRCKLHYCHVCAWNRETAKALYRKYAVEPPVNETGSRRYWNVIFDGDPQTPLDQHKHFYWRLRPNLVAALKEMV